MNPAAGLATKAPTSVLTRSLTVKRSPRGDHPDEPWEWMHGPRIDLILGWGNGLACVFHTVLAIASLVVASRFDNWKTGGAVLETYSTSLQFNVIEADDAAGIPFSITVKPTYVLDGGSGMYLTWLTFSFFMLSATAHFVLTVGAFQGWYFQWIHDCRQPLRYEPSRPHHRPSSFPDLSLSLSLSLYLSITWSGGSSTASRQPS